MNDVIGYLAHEFGPEKLRMRIHRPNWMADQFEIVTWEEFEAFRRIAIKIGFVFVNLETHPDYS